MRGSSSDMLAVRSSILRNVLPLHAKHYGTVVDIGAHIGSFSAKISGRADRVIAFEPVSDNYALLEAMTSAGARMEMHRMAVTGDGREIVVHRHRMNTGAHSIFERDEPAGSERVHSMSSAAIVELACGVIDLLKVDVEGAEHEILRDGSLISASREMLIEMHQVPDVDVNLLERIDEAGFHMAWTGSMVLHAFRRSHPGTLKGVCHS